MTRRGHRTRSRQSGFTLIEVTAAIVIMIFAITVTITAFSNFRARKTMDGAVEQVLAVFSQAHLDTISSKDDRAYGVHLQSDRAVYFVAPTYDSSTTTNKSFVIHPAIEITNITLSGSTTDVVFQRFTGQTSQTGTFELRVKANSLISTVVTVQGTGSISL